MRICQQCGAISQEKRWFYDPELLRELQRRSQAELVVCPGCQRVQDRHVDGVVSLRSRLVLEHKREMISLIANEEARVKAKNPLARVLEITDSGDELVVLTTNERLAQRIGNVFKKAYSGTLEFQWSHQDHFVRVNWRRE